VGALNRKSVLRGIAVTGGIGAIVGATIVYQRVSDAERWIAAVEESRALIDRADEAYRAGANERSAAALRQYLDYLERSSPTTAPWRPDTHPFLDAQGLAAARTLIATRIALVEERRGEFQRADDSWRRAERHAATTTLRAADREALKKRVLDIDQNVDRRHRRPD
jgi:hypothetical protein